MLQESAIGAAVPEGEGTARNHPCDLLGWCEQLLDLHLDSFCSGELPGLPLPVNGAAAGPGPFVTYFGFLLFHRVHY